MKTKIFKHVLLAVIAALAISTTVSAQDSLAVPPMPPVQLKVYKFKEDKAFKQNMADLKVKMKNLQVQMNQKNFKMKMDMDMKFAFKDLGKSLSDNFKDFGKNFAGSFSELKPDFSDLKGVNSNNCNTGDYKEKLASGQMTEKIKNYSKSYSVDANDVLQISNSFGKVAVNTWNKNEFKVDVQMKFAADDEDYVENMIEGSSISDSKVGSLVSFRTNLARNNNSHGDNHMEVNYTVYMPAGNAVDITNKFDDISLPNLSGKVTVKLSFGNLVAQQLTNSQNDIQIKFTQDKTSLISLFNGGKLRLAYVKLKAGTINNVDADISFSAVDVDKLKNSASFRIKYGDGIRVASVDRSVRNLSVNASYTKVRFDFKNADSFNFDVITKLGDFNYNDDTMKVTAKTPTDEDRGWSSTKTYRGYIGKNNSDGKIAVTASFTDVKFN